MALSGLAFTPAARAENFLSALFGSFSGQRAARAPAVTPMFYGSDQPDAQPQFPPAEAPRPLAGSGSAYCVRTCDGRYFPATGSDRRSKAEVCNSFCPTSETKVFYGSSIDRATTEGGKAYSDLPNAFKYRETLVANCTCNGKDPVGLASIKIEKDATLRKGDIVAGPDGLVVASKGADRRGASLNFSPASREVRARFSRVPVVAAD